MKKMKQGKVFFIGAGPGDPELLTLKGKSIIEKADVLIYAGSLVTPQVLNHKKNEIEKWTEGKYKGLHILGNRTRKYARWIREVEKLGADASNDRT